MSEFPGLLDPSDVTFGVTCRARPRAADLRRWEEMDVNAFWAGGHVATPHPTPEAITSLAWLVAHSAKAVVGTSVLLLAAYPPALVAKQIAEVDRWVDGRTVVGVGVGGEFPTDYAAVQVPLRERGRRTDEGIAVVRGVWSGDPHVSGGGFFPMEGVQLSPGPHRPGGPPIVIAGRQAAAVRRAARNNGWMPYLYSPDRYRASAKEIEAMRGDLRDFAMMLWIVVRVDRSSEAAHEEAVLRHPGGGGARAGERTQRTAAVGTVREVVSRLCEYVDAGTRHFICAVSPHDQGEQIRVLADEVMPAVRLHFETCEQRRHGHQKQ